MATAAETKEGEHNVNLVGFSNFKRSNPLSDKFETHKFHHIEFWCGDATNTSRRFQWGLGMKQVAKSDMSTGNRTYASYVLKSHEVTFAFTAPYNNPEEQADSQYPHHSYSQEAAFNFFREHGLAVRAVGISCADAAQAYEISVANGAEGVQAPVTLRDDETGTTLVYSEVKVYGDVVMRWMSGDYQGPFIPGYENVDGFELDYGLKRMDHLVGNVPVLADQVRYMMNFTGWHEFAEFVASDVGTESSGLNSMVVANNNEMVLMPINEPTHGTKRKSQIQTYIEQNRGAGLQHIAIKTDDIFATMKELRQRSHIGGFEFMPAPNPLYYERVPSRIGEDTLTAEQLKELQQYGLLADKDDQGVLLQIFTKPLGDRPTIFIEIIQRIGCTLNEQGEQVEQRGGCGGFGKGNFSELFKSIEDYEIQMEEAAQAALAKQRAKEEAGTA